MDMTPVRLRILVGLLCLVPVVPAVAGPVGLRGIGVDETLDQGAVLAAALEGTNLKAAGMPLFVRLSAHRAQLEAAPGGPSGFDARLDLYARLGVRVMVTIADPPRTAPEVDGWRGSLRSLVERTRGKVFAWQVGDRIDTASSPKDYAYLLKFVAVQVRSIDPAALIVQASLPASAADWQRQFDAEDVAAYVDASPVAAPGAGDDLSGAGQMLAVVDALAAKVNPTRLAGLTGLVLDADVQDGTQIALQWHLSHMGGRSTFTTCAGDTGAVRRLVRAVAALSDAIDGEVVTLDERASSLTLLQSGRDVTGSVPHRLLYNMTTFATYLVCWGPPGEMTVRLHLATPGVVVLRDTVGGRSARPLDVAPGTAANVIEVRVALDGRVAVLDFNYGAKDAYAVRADTTGRATPTVDEIIFRNQQAETAQAARLRNYMAHARMALHFQPSATDSVRRRHREPVLRR